MRIALIGLHFAEYSARLALALAEEHEVLLVLREDNANRELTSALSKRMEAASKLTVRSVRHRSLKDFRIFTEAYQLYLGVKAFGPDIVHCQEYPTDYCAPPVLALWQYIPGILTIHDHVAHTGSALTRRAKYYRSWLRRKADRLIVHGKSIRSELIEYGKWSGDMVEAIPHGVLGGESIPFPMSDAEPATILFFGRIEAYKGLSDLLSACELLVNRGVSLRLLIAGRGGDLETHRPRLAGFSWVELKEDFIPADAVPILFQRATIVALPYTDATQSGVAALAFALGRTVIATNTGALPEVVISGQTGVLVSPRSPSELAEALADILADRTKLESLALGATSFARTELNWKTIAQRTTAAYEAAIQRRRGIQCPAVF